MRVGSYIRSLKSSVSALASSRWDVRFRCTAVRGFAVFVPRAPARGRVCFAMASYYQRITVLLNARAGKQDATPARQVADAFRDAGADVDIRLAEGPALVREAADAVRRGSEVVVAAGGGGTVSAPARALSPSTAAPAGQPR